MEGSAHDLPLAVIPYRSHQKKKAAALLLPRLYLRLQNAKKQHGHGRHDQNGTFVADGPIVLALYYGVVKDADQSNLLEVLWEL